MADLMIKGLAPNVKGAVPVNGAESEESKDAMQVFASLMSRNDGPVTNSGALANEAKNRIASSDTTLTPDAIRDKVVKEMPAATDNISKPETKETLQEYNEKIKEAVMEEYDITEEELEEVMETLGLDYIQLLLPENLVKLSVEITGAADSLELLSNTGFNNLFGMMQELSAEITQEINIPVTPESVLEFAEVINPVEASDIVVSEVPIEATENFEEISAADLNQGDVYADINVVTTEEQTEVQNEADATLADKIETLVENGIEKGTVEVRITDTEKTDSTTPEAEIPAEEVGVQDQSAAVGVAGDIEENAQNGSQQESKEQKDPSAQPKELLKPTAKEIKTENSTNAVNAAPVDNFRNLAPETPIEAPAPLSQADTESIIRQINDYMRINVNGPETSLEMQLNPENLGKVGINLSVRDGVVTAQIAVENAAVKNALEGQMVILRENMNNQGLKVEAVEVTVASHEFEQNLENGAPAGGEQQQNHGQQTTRRIISGEVTSLEEMPEDEQLAAKIMRDNGNTMDVTA